MRTLAAADTAVAALSSICEMLVAGMASVVADDGTLSREQLNARQPEAFDLARALAEREAAHTMLAYAQHDAAALDLACIYIALACRRAAERAVMGAPLAFACDASPLKASASFVASTLSTDNLGRIAGDLLARSDGTSGPTGLGETHEQMHDLFGAFSNERIAPIANDVHRNDTIIPEPLLQELAAMGVFGISIPEKYGGSFVDHLTMCIATEELSRGSLGAGGSVITRPEICSKAILVGGTEAQKQHWLPLIASGERIVSVAVTEPNAGSDVAAVRVSATRVESGYLIDGEKTWCTFAGRADVIVLLARTGGDGAKGLSLFLVEKPATIGGDEYRFEHVQPAGGVVRGRAIPTVGYRGMHSFAVHFESYFVPAENRIGQEGEGFALQMQGFIGGRIQTASRAVGVMEAAYRAAVEYSRTRHVFGKPLADYSLTRAKLALMAATVQASRQLSYRVARLMDDKRGSMEASLVKLLACKDAEWVTREAMQLHGGMGYSEEFTVSRLWQDARVLSLFEGAEEVLAIHVVARQVLREHLART